MAHSIGGPLRLGTGSRRAANLPPKEVRAPPWPNVNHNNLSLLLQTDIIFTSPTHAVRPFFLL